METTEVDLLKDELWRLKKETDRTIKELTEANRRLKEENDILSQFYLEENLVSELVSYKKRLEYAEELLGESVRLANELRNNLENAGYFS